VSASADKCDNVRFLFDGLDRAGTVVGADPRDRLAPRMTGHDRKAGQGCTGAPVSPEATELHPFPGTSLLEHGSQGDDDVGRAIGNAEIRPVEVIMGPGRFPLVIKIEPVVRWLITDIGVRSIERHGDDLDAVRQYDHRTVKMHFNPCVRVIRFGALGRFKVQVPVHSAFGASHNRACVDHVTILAARGTSPVP
jgi:hypothetical protein